MSITDNKYNITMWQGSTFSLMLTVQDDDGVVQNLTNYSAVMQIRTSYKSGVVAETLTTDDGEIYIDGTAGVIYLSLSAERTAAMDVNLTNGTPPRSNYVYDLELTDSYGNVIKLIYGSVTLYGEVTR